MLAPPDRREAGPIPLALAGAGVLTFAVGAALANRDDQDTDDPDAPALEGETAA